jgi:alpha-galactosidase
LETIGYADDGLELRIEVDQGGMARITRLAAPSGAAACGAALPLVDVILAGEGRAWSGRRYCESEVARRLRYAGHDLAEAGSAWRELRVDLSDPVTGLRAEVFYRVLAGQGALRSWVRLTNAGDSPVTVESVTSFLCGIVSDEHNVLSELDVLWAENDWLAENRWQRRAWRDAVPDLNRRVHGADPRGRFGLTSAGTWSSGGYLPMGAITSSRGGSIGGPAWVWQIEHNGGWHWQTGECTARRGGDRTDGLDLNHAPAGAVTAPSNPPVLTATAAGTVVNVPPGGSVTCHACSVSAGPSSAT